MRVQDAVAPRAGNSSSISTKDVSNDDCLLAKNAVCPETFRDCVLILTQTESSGCC